MTLKVSISSFLPVFAPTPPPVQQTQEAINREDANKKEHPFCVHRSIRPLPPVYVPPPETCPADGTSSSRW